MHEMQFVAGKNPEIMSQERVAMPETMFESHNESHVRDNRRNQYIPFEMLSELLLHC